MLDPDNKSDIFFKQNNEKIWIIICIILFIFLLIEFFYILNLRYKYLDLKDKNREKDIKEPLEDNEK